MFVSIRRPFGTRRTRLATSAIAAISTLSLAPTVGSAAASPTRLTIGALPAAPTLGVLPQIDALGSQVIAIAPAEGLTAESSLTASSGNLWFSRLDDRPTKLQLAGVPAWAQPHLGTDAAGRAVAIYPRCAGTARSSCDLYAWDVAANTERPLTEANRRDAGELEGTMAGGALAWTVAPADEAATAADTPDAERTLMYRPAGGAPKLASNVGGRRLALRSGQIAQTVLASDQETSRVELIDVRAAHAARSFGSRVEPAPAGRSGCGSSVASCDSRWPRRSPLGSTACRSLARAPRDRSRPSSR